MAPEEVDYILRLLDTVIRTSGVPRAEIDHKLGQSLGYLSRLLNGRIEVKLRQVFEVLDLIHMEPAEFFHIAYPRSPTRRSGPTAPPP